MARPAVQLPMQGTFQCDTVNCGREHLRWGVGKLAATAEVTPTILPMYHRGMNEVVPSNADRATTAVNFPTAGKKVALRIGDPIDITDLLDEYRTKKQLLAAGSGGGSASASTGAAVGVDPLRVLRRQWYMPCTPDSDEGLLYSAITLRIENALRALEAEVQAEHGRMVNVAPALRELGLTRHTGSGIDLQGRD